MARSKVTKPATPALLNPTLLQDGDYVPPGEPTASQIRLVCEEIQKTWTVRDELISRGAVYPKIRYIIPQAVRAVRGQSRHALPGDQ